MVPPASVFASTACAFATALVNVITKDTVLSAQTPMHNACCSEITVGGTPLRLDAESLPRVSSDEPLPVTKHPIVAKGIVMGDL